MPAISRSAGMASLACGPYLAMVLMASRSWHRAHACRLDASRLGPGRARHWKGQGLSRRELRRHPRRRLYRGSEGQRGAPELPVASQYGKLGISLRCANTERVSGWAEILHRLGDPAPQCGVPIAPRLFIHERCARLVECLPALQHDPNRPEDVLKVDVDEDGNGGDDTADCLRYLVATKSRVVAQRKLRGL